MKRPSEIKQEELCRMLTEMSELERKIELIDHRLTHIYEEMQADTNRYLDEIDLLIDKKGLRGFLLAKTRTTRDNLLGDDCSADVLLEYARRRPVTDEMRMKLDDFEAERQRHPRTSGYSHAGSRFIILATQGRMQKKEYIERLLKFTFFDKVYDPGQAARAIIYAHSHNHNAMERTDVDFASARYERFPEGDRPRDSAFEQKVELMKTGIAEQAAVYIIYNPSMKITPERLTEHAKEVLCTQYYNRVYQHHDSDRPAKKEKYISGIQIVELDESGRQHIKQLAEMDSMQTTGRWKRRDPSKPN